MERSGPFAPLPPTNPGRRRRLWAVLLGLLVLLGLIKSHLHFYSIPTSSMEGTVPQGSHITISGLTYGQRVGDIRLPGLRQPQRNDLVVFNFPEGDTVVLGFPNMDYYQLARMCGHSTLLEEEQVIFTSPDGRILKRPTGGIEVRSIHEKEPYLKRCVAVAGDTVSITQGIVSVNGQAEVFPEQGRYDHIFILSDRFNLRRLEEDHRIRAEDVQGIGAGSVIIPLSPATAGTLEHFRNVVSMTRESKPRGAYGAKDFWPIFPNDPRYDWSEDDFGPLYIPKAGVTLQLTEKNLPLYRRVIEVYEHNTLETRGEDILINGVKVTSYTFQQDYYWMMGDNRHRALDSRFWGFVPFDHIIGKVVAVI